MQLEKKEVNREFHHSLEEAKKLQNSVDYWTTTKKVIKKYTYGIYVVSLEDVNGSHINFI